jgi:ABC-2 type transport system ATP-binding protein
MPHTVGRAGAAGIGPGVEAASTPGSSAKFDPRADDGGTPGRQPGHMLTNSLDVAVAERRVAPVAPAVTVRGLRKRYGERMALDGVDLTLRRGELLALLGPNGAGKTTLVEILEGHRHADDGEVEVLGFDPARRERAFRERIGIVLQEEGIDHAFTVGEAVDIYSAAYPRRLPADEVIELVGLTDRAYARVGTLSGGQRRRLDLALGIAGDPDLIFLDEPTTGFDPAARRQSWELISNLRSLGTTILLTTHYMDEAQHLADRVVVLSGGRVIADGPPDTLGRHADAAVVAFRLPAGAGAAELPLPANATVEERRVRFRGAAPTHDLAPVLAWAAARDAELDGLTVTRPNLEDVYLELTEEVAA